MTRRARVRTKAALVMGAVGIVVLVAAGSVGAAAPAYDFEAGDSGALSGRVFTAAATAADGDSVVLYGGAVPGQNGDSLADTWVHTDAGWVAKCGTTVPGATAPCAPGPRSAGTMAPGPTGAVLFGGGPQGIDGGGGGGPLPSDTWVWTGDAWQQACASGACGPEGRFFPALGGNGEEVVLFGGIGSGGVFDDTWVFDGTSWTQTCGTGAPVSCGVAGLAAGAIGWDGTQFVMFGGSPFGASDPVPPTDDTWTFDGTKWTQACGSSMSKPCGPAARSLASAAFQRQPEPTLQGMVMGGGGNLFGGSDQSLQRDVWFWRAGTWTQLATPWDDAPVSWTEGEQQPPPGSGPLIPLLAGRTASCGVLLVGQNPVGTGASFSLAPETFTGGWDLNGAGAPSGCTAAPAGNPTGVPTDTSAGSGDGSASGSGGPSTGSIARTGRSSDVLAIVGAGAVVLGLGAMRVGRPRVVGRARTATR